MRNLAFFLLPLALLAVTPSVTVADDQARIILQSTTSTKNSGLYDVLLPKFTEQTSIRVDVVAVGTGQAIRNASNCDGDVLLVHAKSAELGFVESGYGKQRHDVMYNDFVLVGPSKDSANVTSSNNINEALGKIATNESLFASRGDDSGTHKKEQSLWQRAGVAVAEASGAWYRESGSGMGATLNLAVGMGAYTLTDRATWISFQNKGDFVIVYEGDQNLFNQYGIIAVNETKCPNVNVEASQRFIDWILSEQGQVAINAYELAGQQLFFANTK